MQNHGLAIKLGVQPTEKPYIKRFMQGHDPRYFTEGFGYLGLRTSQASPAQFRRCSWREVIAAAGDVVL